MKAVKFIEYSFLMHHLDLHDRHFNQTWPIILIEENTHDGAYVLVKSVAKHVNGKYKVKL